MLIIVLNRTYLYLRSRSSLASSALPLLSLMVLSCLLMRHRYNPCLMNQMVLVARCKVMYSHILFNLWHCSVLISRWNWHLWFPSVAKTSRWVPWALQPYKCLTMIFPWALTPNQIPCTLSQESDAMSHVAGYTVAHDVSARDWQLHRNGGQWLIGKTMDTYCPLGPAIVTTSSISGTLLPWLLYQCCVDIVLHTHTLRIQTPIS